MIRSEQQMSGSGHSLPGRAGGKPGHLRYASKAEVFCSAAHCRDVPKPEVTAP
jgi:hypothetical protein